MQVINKNEIENNSRLIKDLKNDKTVIFPTETVYGISANAYNDKAVEKIYEIKGRDFNKPLIVLINSYDMLEEFTENISDYEKKIMNKFWPGALTIILKLKKNSNLSKYCYGNKETIGVRMTSSPIAKYLINEIGMPIVSTSANKSGEELSNNIDTIIDTFKDEVDYFIKGEIDENEQSSTIIEVIDNKVNVLREGKITKEEIMSINFI